MPLRALNHLSTIEAPQDGRRKSPELFVKRVYEETELDNQLASGVATSHAQRNTESAAHHNANRACNRRTHRRACGQTGHQATANQGGL